MTMLTEKYLDEKLSKFGIEINVKFGELTRRMDDRFDQIDEKIDDLAGMTARGFTELRTEILLNED